MKHQSPVPERSDGQPQPVAALRDWGEGWDWGGGREARP